MTATIKGVIRDSGTGDPLMGATVSSMQDRYKGTTTDFDGVFSIKASPTERFIVSYLGYKAKQVTAAELQRGVSLEEEGFSTDEIIITATPRSQKKTNYLLYGGIGLGVLAVGYLVFSKN